MQNESNENIIRFNSKYELLMAKEILYQKVHTKIDLFEECLNEVGLYKTFPFLDVSYLFKFTKNIIPYKMKKFPIDHTESLLMRNCVRRNSKNIQDIKLYFNK